MQEGGIYRGGGRRKKNVQEAYVQGDLGQRIKEDAEGRASSFIL